jgi:hypothetical protein
MSLTGKALTLAWGGRDTVKAASILRADRPIGAAAPAALREVKPPAKQPKPSGLRASALRNVLILALLATIVVAATLLFALNGWHYYRTPLGVRGYTPEHRLLRPSGTVGLLLGISGATLMVLMQSYSVRKRLRRLNRLGSLPRWLEFHIFCGILGPVLITFHTSFKFNGIVSVAYWSMLLVVASGFVGRYLFVRIPKSIRGQELTYAEVEQRAADLKGRLLETRLPLTLLKRVEAFEERALPPRHRTALAGDSLRGGQAQAQDSAAAASGSANGSGSPIAPRCDRHRRRARRAAAPPRLPQEDEETL